MGVFGHPIEPESIPKMRFWFTEHENIRLNKNHDIVISYLLLSSPPKPKKKQNSQQQTSQKKIDSLLLPSKKTH